MQFSYDVHAVSLLCKQKTSLKPKNFFGPPQRHIESALKMGWDGVQVVPIHGLTGLESGIGLFEDAWNPVNNLGQVVLRLPGAGDEPSRVTDWVVSPSPEECAAITATMTRRGLVQVVHDFDGIPNHVVEVRLMIGMTPERYVLECQWFKQWLCLDTYHLMDGWQSHEIAQHPELEERPSPLVGRKKNWRLAVMQLAPWVQIIHVHPENVDDFIANPAGTRAGKIVETCLKFGGKDRYTLVAEYDPGRGRILDPAKSQATARGMLRAMKQLTAPFR